MIPIVRAYVFLSFNHFVDIEVAKSWITFFRKGKNTLCNKQINKVSGLHECANK